MRFEIARAACLDPTEPPAADLNYYAKYNYHEIVSRFLRYAGVEYASGQKDEGQS
jgi:hypothetical protein